ncbi:hypothetical protein PROFUN_04136 [Planoprotostelium fungivorum]|uniref:AB hydrolase-1 domain-containing protein n=1 Tax=Planoprotostelium fungivorum TaxID=1890364 RepID=A0A2P6NJK4_9EUKA|nr:hypothetical protein PROFUN_04136 [Planoprotostelium fungivorum]
MPNLIVGESRRTKATINYMVHGDGPVKILFVMGLASTLDSWKMQVDAFVKLRDEQGNPTDYDSKYSICVYDNRGIGLSSSPLGRYTTEMMALDGLELLAHLQWKQFHLIGLSMGGMIALRMSVLLISRNVGMPMDPIPSLLSLMLVVTHYGGPHSDQPETGKKMAKKLLFALTEKKRTKKILPMLFSKRFLSDPKNYQDAFDGIIASRKIEGGKPPIFGFLGQLHAVSRHRVKPEELQLIRDSQVPVMVMTGDEDHMVDPRNSAEMNELLQPVEYIVMPETGHAINAERAAEFNEAMFRHVERGEARLQPMATPSTDTRSTEPVTMQSSLEQPTVLVQTQMEIVS